MNISRSYHPETDGQTKRVNQILCDLQRAYVLEFQGKWEDDLRWWSFLITIATSPPLEWLCLRLYVGESIEPHRIRVT